MILPVQITFRNLEAEPGLEEYVRQQAEKLDRYYGRITSCRVMVELLGRHARGNRYHVRIDLGLADGELLVESEPDLHAGMRDVAEERVTKSAELGRLHKTPRTAVLDSFKEMRRRLQDFARKQRLDVKQQAQPLALGEVVDLHPSEGFGFVRTRLGRRVYFHRDAVLGGRFEMLRAGSKVRFCEEPGDKGPHATTVRIVHPRKQAMEAAASVPMR
jgi:cold shock CspA family protein/ribosome-associated translation inhibitor RaiA